MSQWIPVDEVRVFGERMLSPYRGVMHTIATAWADAATIDGRTWTLYVRGECLYDDPDEVADPLMSVPDVKFGTWSAERGFHRAPIRLPTFDDRVCAAGDQLLAAVERHAGELPFSLADRFERWLLAGTGEPLALIESTCSLQACSNDGPLRWTPGQQCLHEVQQMTALSEAIAALAGHDPRAQWFERNADGSGIARSAVDGGAPLDATLPATRFDPLFVGGALLDQAHVHLLEQLHRWQSPALLQLPTLSDAERSRLEHAACRYAERVAMQLPLYPCVIDGAAITAALVEARLRRSAPRAAVRDAGRDDLSPDYIEIPD